MTSSSKKTYLILNASSGVGQAVSTKLSEDNLILTARDTSKIQQFDKEGNQMVALDFSSAPQDDFKKAIQQVDLDGVVVITPRPALGNSYMPEPHLWEDSFHLCFINPLEALRLAIPQIKTGGKIVVIGAVSTVQNLDKHQSYAVLRMMWLAQAKSLARQLAKDKIHVNTVAPGGIMTEEFQKLIAGRARANGCSFDEQYAKETDNIPLQDYATPEQMANVTRFFLSPESNHITGVNVPMDGGFHRSY